MKIRSIMMSLLVLPLMGCSIQGKWVAVGDTPADASCKFQDATFNDDGTFAANAEVANHGKQHWTGTYKMDMMGKLTLTPEKGEARHYEANVMGDTLKVTSKTEERSITQEFKRVKCEACGSTDTCKCEKQSAAACTKCPEGECKCEKAAS